MKQFKTNLAAFLVALLLPVVVSAQSLCWDEGGGNTLVLSPGLSNGNDNILYGHRSVPAAACKGKTKFPVTAAAIVDGSQVILGMQVHAVDPGICVSSRRFVILNLSNLSGSGSWRNDVGSEGSFTLTKLSTCPTGADQPLPGTFGLDIENQVVK